MINLREYQVRNQWKEHVEQIVGRAKNSLGIMSEQEVFSEGWRKSESSFQNYLVELRFAYFKSRGEQERLVNDLLEEYNSITGVEICQV